MLTEMFKSFSLFFSKTYSQPNKFTYENQKVFEKSFYFILINLFISLLSVKVTFAMGKKGNCDFL